METLQENLDNLDINSDLKTGVLFDEEMKLHKSKKQHVENPARMIQILKHLQDQNLVLEDEEGKSKEEKTKFDHSNIEVVRKLNLGEKEDILLAHDNEYVEFVDNVWPENHKRPNVWFLDTYANQHSTKAAYLGVGGTIQAIQNVLNGVWNNAFAIIRPPGHHSGHASKPTGFCYFNNIAIGAKYAIQKLGLKKVVILDWDIHHGDGTQNLTEDDPNILYISIHRHDFGKFYPGESGSIENVGIEKGKGFNVNIPWNLDLENDKDFTARNEEYIYIMERIIIPILQSYQPELLLISSGFDGCKDDPLGQCELDIDGYAYMTSRLMQVMGNNKIVVNLEGGYNLDQIPKAAEGVLRALVGEQLPIKNSLNKKNMKQTIQNCIPNKIGFETKNLCVQELSKYWPVLYKDQSAIEFEKQCLLNVQQSSKYWDEDTEELNQELIQIQQGPKLEQKFKIIKAYPGLQQLFFGKITEKNELFIQSANPFQNIENGSILKITFGKSEENDPKKKGGKPGKGISSHWKKQSFKVDLIAIKDSNGIPQNITVWEDLKTRRKFNFFEVFDKFLTQNNPEQMKSNLDLCIELKQFLSTLQNQIQNVDRTVVKSVQITSICDGSNKKIHNFISDLQYEDLEQESVSNLDIVKGIQQLSDIIKKLH